MKKNRAYPIGIPDKLTGLHTNSVTQNQLQGALIGHTRDKLDYTSGIRVQIHATLYRNSIKHYILEANTGHTRYNGIQLDTT